MLALPFGAIKANLKPIYIHREHASQSIYSISCREWTGGAPKSIRYAHLFAQPFSLLSRLAAAKPIFLVPKPLQTNSTNRHRFDSNGPSPDSTLNCCHRRRRRRPIPCWSQTRHHTQQPIAKRPMKKNIQNSPPRASVSHFALTAGASSRRQVGSARRSVDDVGRKYERDGTVVGRAE